LNKTGTLQAINILNNLIAMQVFGEDVLRQLISTPKMKELLSRGYGKDDGILEAAGQAVGERLNPEQSTA
jgi:hypothetical protein